MQKNHTQPMRTLVIMPAYNAADTIVETIARIPLSFRCDLLVIDDGSSDRTRTLAQEMGVKVFSHRRNLGYGAAQKTGLGYSLKHGFDCVVVLHADGQYPPEKMRELTKPIRDGIADVVVGSRMLKGSVRNEMPAFKQAGNKLLTKLENMVLRSSISGFHCGLRAYSTKFIRSIEYLENSNGFEFDSEMVFQAISGGHVIQEIPVDAYYRQETSHLRSIPYGISVVKLVIKYLFHKSHLRPNSHSRSA